MEQGQYAAIDVFTPSCEPRVIFVERPDEVHNPLLDALRTPGKQVVVFGVSGSGKSSLVEHVLRRTHSSHVTTTCKNFSADEVTFKDLLDDALDQLAAMSTSSTSATDERTREGEARGGFSLPIVGKLILRISESRTSKKTYEHSPIAPAQRTPRKLFDHLHDLDACWVLDDFDCLPENVRQEAATALKSFNVFASKKGSSSRTKCVVVGSSRHSDEMLSFETSMQSRIGEVPVPLMGDDEILRIMDEGELHLGVSLLDDVKVAILKLSGGLASVCHQLCLTMCQMAGVETTRPPDELAEFDIHDLQQAKNAYLAHSPQRVRAQLKEILGENPRNAYRNAQLVLGALCSYGPHGATSDELLDGIRTSTKDYPRANLTVYLERLVNHDEGILVLDDLTDRYSFRDPILGSLLRAELLEFGPGVAADQALAGDASLGSESDRGFSEDTLRSVLERFLSRMSTELEALDGEGLDDDNA